ncbi:MAG TPA: hypothetical protein PK743_01485 [Luteimonas sp.]|nr:hypothetical protein [Luteimonas sp.]
MENIEQRLKQQFTDCHLSEIAAAVVTARAYATSQKGALTEYDTTGLVFLHAAMHLTRSDHLKQCYSASIQALLHPYRHPAGVTA